jgi:diguanylate cyclase (GGDEF)-like protein
MGTAASPFLHPITAELESAGPQPTSKVLRRRLSHRRQVHAMLAVSYLLDALLLWTYACAGTITPGISSTYASWGLLTLLAFVTLSETGFCDRFKDHYLVVPQAAVNLATALAFTYVAPEVGVLFLSKLFLISDYGLLRATTRQSAVICVWTALALAGLFLLTDRPIGMPMGNMLERVATLLVFVTTLGRCIFLGVFASSMRHSLYQNGLKLKEAYRRIEELAELDELTGSFNRRSIMRILEEEITRARRIETGCSVALIDLDWFKRINDAFGHPTGDEVLRTFAITVFANIRTIDRFGRYGGEEFLLVLPETGEPNAAGMLDRLREIVADLDWSAFSPGMHVTMSAGVATLRPGESSDSLLARADDALYASKAKGRNRITTA